MTEADWRTEADPAPLLRFADDRLTDRVRLLFMAGCCRRVWDLLRDARFRRLVEAAEARADGRATEEELQAAAGEIPVAGARTPPERIPLLEEEIAAQRQFRLGGPRVSGGGVIDFHLLPQWCQRTHHAAAAVGGRGYFAVAEGAEMAAAHFAEERVTERHPLHEEIRDLREEVRRAHDRTEDLRWRGAVALSEQAADTAATLERQTNQRIQILDNEIWSAGAAERLDRAREERAAQAALIRCLLGNPFRPAVVEPAWLTSSVVALARGIEADQAFDRLPILADALQDAGCDHDDFLSHCRDERVHARGCWVVDALLRGGPRHNLPSA